MRNIRLTGPGAGAEKYDLLTAMAVTGLAVGGTMQSSMMRLMALVTARYNWSLDEVSIGQKDMAALWAVDERTAKRETKRLIEGGFLIVKRPGVRGRVAAYRLNLENIYACTEARWTNVGSDFQARMGARTKPADNGADATKVVRVDFGMKLKSAPPPNDGSPWAAVQIGLATQHPKLFPAWFEPLCLGGVAEDCATVIAPSKFAAQYITTHLLGHLDAALSAAFGKRMHCMVTAGQKA